MRIPRVIHQLWRDTAVPERYQPLVESWRRHHPGWDYRLWTDATMRALVAEQYPHFLATYDGYDLAICRADAARYLIIHAFGGLYVDLDMHCLRPIDALIEGKELAVAVEPAGHLDSPKVKARGFDKLVCPSFIASAEAQPFFEHLVRLMEAARPVPEPLDRTGPFMLTRAFDQYVARSSLTLLPADTVYPLSKLECWSGKAFDIEFFERATRTAYAVHYWDGTWFRKPSHELPAMPPELKLTVTGATGARRGSIGSSLVSCLMVTRARYRFACLAIEAFRRQTYAERELVVVQDGTDTRLVEEIERAGDPTIRAIRPPAEGLSLGALRNLAVAEARGPIVCQWDDDDLYDPGRIALQMKALKGAEAEACFLSRWLMWMPSSRRLGISPPHLWEGSMLAVKAALPAYPNASHSEDTKLVYELRRRSRIALLDMPRLYVYAFHGRNVWDADHFEVQWQRCETRYTGERYAAIVNELGRRLPITAYEDLLAQDSEPAAPGTLPPRSSRFGQLAATGAARRAGCNLFGHMASPTGIGVAARATAAALAAARIPYAVFDLDQIGGEPTQAENEALLVEGSHPINLFHTTPDRIQRFVSGRDSPIPPTTLIDRYNIACFAWESTNSFPQAWRGAFRHFDEVWVPTRFVAECLRPVTSLPIVEIPHVLQTRPVVLSRADFALPKDRFVFLFTFDEPSGFARKNPLGAIAAFKRAFAADDKHVALFIKARTLSHENRARLTSAATGYPIVIFVEDIGRKALSSLVAHADAFVSLHRAEGFGLALAEAMQLERPVVATAYSGNLDFMTPENSYLVPCRIVRQEEPDGIYPAGTEWAEPDLDAAAEMMRAVVADPAAARRRAQRAAADIAARFSPLAVAGQIERRLAVLSESRRLAPVGANATMPRAGAGESRRQPSATAVLPITPAAPAVLVLTPLRNAAAYLPRYFDLLGQLDYDRGRLSLGMLEGDSDDRTHDELVGRLPDLRLRYRRVTVLKHDFGHRLVGPRWRPEAQRARRGVLARARNRLLAEALADEVWVLWLDVDLVDYPPTLITDLIAAGKEIVVPHCVRPDGQTFDLNSFRFAPERGPIEDPAHFVDGLYQPPRGHGRLYVGDLGGADGGTCNRPLPIDAVGGTALLVKADLHREGLIFPPYSHRGYIETEGLAMMARDMGHQCWALPGVRIVHGAR